MKTAVITFPGSNGDRDMRTALELVTGTKTLSVWHNDTTLPKVDVVALPGGFSYGDYLRTGCMAAQSPIMRAVKDYAARGGKVLGVCNGFQILCESGLLPGVLLRNRDLLFLSKSVSIVDHQQQSYTIPIAHHDGNYFIQTDGLKSLEDQGQIAFRYENNPNGSVSDIAGIYSKAKNILGMMPHPERAVDPHLHSGADGQFILSHFLGL
jgi:phosphoribosylformylglycinamidine synthase subunit PurQ / glutaminase